MNHLLFYIILTGGLLMLVGGVLVWWGRRRGHRFGKTREQLETEDVLSEAFGKNMKWGSPATAQDEVEGYQSDVDSGDAPD
jgi:hypothetical protein